jgi:hypothetical protein
MSNTSKLHLFGVDSDVSLSFGMPIAYRCSTVFECTKYDLSADILGRHQQAVSSMPPNPAPPPPVIKQKRRGRNTRRSSEVDVDRILIDEPIQLEDLSTRRSSSSTRTGVNTFKPFLEIQQYPAMGTAEFANQICKKCMGGRLESLEVIWPLGLVALNYLSDITVHLAEAHGIVVYREHERR